MNPVNVRVQRQFCYCSPFEKKKNNLAESVTFGQHLAKRIIVKPIINWTLSNSLNAYNRHSDWHKLEVYATKMSIYFWVSL